MKKDYESLEDTVILFVNTTLNDIKNGYEIPTFSISFPNDAYDFFKEIMKNPPKHDDEYRPNICDRDFETLDFLENYDNNLSRLIIKDTKKFFKYLTIFSNRLAELYRIYEGGCSTRALQIRLFRRIWLRMAPSDFMDVEKFLLKQIQSLEDETFTKYRVDSLIGTMSSYDIYARSGFNRTWDENNKYLEFYFEDKETKAMHDLPKIYYDIASENGKKICYIGAIQNEVYRERNPKVERMLYRLNKGVFETESDEYKNFFQSRKGYYPENISDVYPGSILSLHLMSCLLQEEGIDEIRTPLLHVLSYDYHIIFGKDVKRNFQRKWKNSPPYDRWYFTEREKNASIEEYEYDKAWYQRVVGKEDFISKNKTENFLRIFRRVAYHDSNFEIMNEPFVQGDYLIVKLNNKNSEMKPEFLQEVHKSLKLTK